MILEHDGRYRYILVAIEGENRSSFGNEWADATPEQIEQHRAKLEQMVQQSGNPSVRIAAYIARPW